MAERKARLNEFGHWLKRRRRELDLTQDALAERIDCSLATLYKIEAGTRRPSRQVAALLAQALAIPPEQQEAFLRLARLPLPTEQLPAAALTGPPPPASRPPPLPAQFTPLLGRNTEIAALGHLLQAGTRLLTLVGPPGVGKTRLAIEATRQHAAAWSDGVGFVGLAPLHDSSLVLGTIAGTLGVPEVAGQSTLETLAACLGTKHLLLVLDNCEQVVEAGPQMLALLAQCPGLQILATSREVLRVHGEQRYPVSPLPLPAAAAPADARTLLDYPAVALFVRSAQAVQPDFGLTDENAAVVLAICRRLDGLPLALELVAARINLLPPAAVLARLNRQLDLLVSGSRDVDVRHQTLRNCISWSYDLLPEAEQRLFRQLGVFAGGWDLDAVTALGQEPGEEPGALLARLGALLDKSLIVPLTSTETGEPRWTMLETIREYATERLDASDEAAAIRRQHAEFYLHLAETARPRLFGPEQRTWLDRLKREHDNVRAALTWCLALAGADSARRLLGVRLAAAMALFWQRHSHLTEGLRWYDQVLGITAPAGGEDAGWTRARMAAWAGLGELAYVQGQHDRAEAAFAESLALARTLADKESSAGALAYLGVVRGYYRHAYAAGRALLAESMGLFQEIGDTWGLARATGFLGYMDHAQGDYPAARGLFEESLALFRAVQDPWGTAWALLILGEAERCLGHYAVANAYYEQSLAINQALGDKQRIATLLNNMANIARNQGDLARALTLFRQCLSGAQEIGNRRLVIDVISGIAGISAAQGQTARAAQLLGAAQALHEATGLGFEPAEQLEFDRHVAAVQTTLGAESFAQAWTPGRSLTLDAALELALGTELNVPPLSPPPGAADPAPLGLTDRQLEVLRLLARGLSNKEIASALTISERTVNTHLVHIFSKLDVNSRSAATAQAIRLGIAE